MKHASQEDLVLLYYGDAEAPADAMAHLEECAECRAAAENLAETLDACGSWQTPEPDADFERLVWEGIAPRLARPDRDWRWLAVAAAIVIALGAFVAGRISRRPPEVPIAGLSAQAREKILEIAIADHLDRAEILLTEMSRARETEADRERARDLVSEGRLLRASLETGGDTALAAVVDEVERFMLEAANGTGPLNGEDFATLLFKVRIVESNLRGQGQKL